MGQAKMRSKIFLNIDEPRIATTSFIFYASSTAHTYKNRIVLKHKNRKMCFYLYSCDTVNVSIFTTIWYNYCKQKIQMFCTIQICNFFLLFRKTFFSRIYAKKCPTQWCTLYNNNKIIECKIMWTIYHVFFARFFRMH